MEEPRFWWASICRAPLFLLGIHNPAAAEVSFLHVFFAVFCPSPSLIFHISYFIYLDLAASTLFFFFLREKMSPFSQNCAVPFSFPFLLFVSEREHNARPLFIRGSPARPWKMKKGTKEGFCFQSSQAGFYRLFPVSIIIACPISGDEN